MIRSRAFAYVTAADFTVRSAYQMGKTPLLPIFAASLGAGDVLLAFIVSVSTLTGMVLKPFIGVLSDRWGRRIWLIVGTVFFALMPFAYRFVPTPEPLFAVRLIHGLGRGRLKKAIGKWLETHPHVANHQPEGSGAVRSRPA